MKKDDDTAGSTFEIRAPVKKASDGTSAATKSPTAANHAKIIAEVNLSYIFEKFKISCCLLCSSLIFRFSGTQKIPRFSEEQQKYQVKNHPERRITCS